MVQMIFVNLPVSELERSVRFYEAIGCRKEPRFSNELAAMMVLSDEISFMLLTHSFFQSFTPKRIADAREVSEVLICLSRNSREAVDALAEAAGRAGGTVDFRPLTDMGAMYGRCFEDPDGHIFELMWMDAAAAEQGASAFEQA